MDLSQIGSIHIFRLPIETSMLATIRQQLWESIDRSPDITNLMTAPLIQCRRIDRQPLTYFSAVSHQLFNSSHPTLSAPYSSPQACGDWLLQKLTATFYDEPTAQWQGAVNSQGYLYLQPTMEAIATGLNQLLSIRTSGVSSCPSSTASSITLQYIYTRCTQLLQLASKAEISLQLTATKSTTKTTSEMELIGAILDVWDHVSTDSASTNISNRRILALSQQLVEKFLEFEKFCWISSPKHQPTTNFSCCLLTVVQTTVKMILQRYWCLEPLSHW